MSGLKDFLMRGNVVDLAVGVVIGAAFGTVVTSFVNDILMQGIGAISGGLDFSEYKIPLSDAPVEEGQEPAAIYYGRFINALISFLIVGAAIYYFVVKPMNAFMARMKKDEETAAAEPSDEVKLLTEIRDALKKA